MFQTSVKNCLKTNKLKNGVINHHTIQQKINSIAFGKIFNKNKSMIR